MQANARKYHIAVLIRRLWGHLSQRRRRQIGLLMCLMLISAFAEVLSIGAVLPFLAVLAAPEKVFANPIVAGFVQNWGIASAADLMLPITIVFATLTLLSAGIRMLLLWVSTRLAYVICSDLSLEVYRRTLFQPLLVHTERNSSTVISGITDKVLASSIVLQQLLTLISSMLVLVAIMSALLVINPIVALTVFLIFGTSYGIITLLFRKRLKRNAQFLALGSTQMIKAIQEGLGAIRDVLLDGTQKIFCDIYRRADYPLRRAEGNNIIIGGSPRFAIEALGMVLIAIFAYSLSRQSGGLSSALPILGALALGAQRMLPALQQSYAAWSNIMGNQASMAETLDFLDQPLPADVLQPAPAPMPFSKVINFAAVSFRYGSNKPWILDGLDISIAKGSRIGLVGSTGSGKSTTLDLLLGLVEPTQGQILVDGQPITGGHLRAWQRNIAHVPQSIYLSDSTVAENIAFGVRQEDIDMEQVKKAAQQARIAEFIENNADGYNALVGERGVRISGGQRQRIGIARALYKQPTVLVFDEATSALDNFTEKEIMEAIEGLSRDITIVIVAHRLSTVRSCDTIIELGGGNVIAQGSYEYLLENSQSFRQMANVVN